MQARDAMLRLIIVLALATSGCGGPSATSLPYVGTEVDFFKASCKTSTYVRCYESLKAAAKMYPGTTLAICEYSGGEGDVVVVGAHEYPEQACSHHGSIKPSRVNGTVQYSGP